MRFARVLALLAALAPFFAFGAAEPDLLEPDQAFQFSARNLGSDAIEVRYQIAPGYYLYRDKFRISAVPETVRLGAPELPPGKRKKDEFFGEVETYRGELRFRVPVTNSGSGDAVTLTVVSQGCADAGVCYVPHEQQARLVLAATTGAFTSPPTASLPDGLFAPQPSVPRDDRGIAKLFQGSFVLLIASFFGFGLLLSFTPCMLPMIPIVSGVIAGHGTRLTKAHGFALAGTYVIGMAITYAAAGVIAGLSGAMLSAALQSPWVIGAFALMFVGLAGAMLGFYELQLPASLQSRLAETANRLHGGHFAGVFAMGVLSALILGPCVAAPLAGALLYISQSRDVVLGGSALFAMAIGMGVPLLAIGASAGALIPKAGPWMELAKRFFGVILLGVAVYIASPLVSVKVQMLAWAAVLLVAAVYLRVFESLPPRPHAFDRIAKVVGVMALVGGVVYAVGAFSGSRDVLRPLGGLLASGEQPPVAFTRVSSLAELDQALRNAGGRPVMLDFYADWCVSCKEMERYTFSDEGVRKRLEQITKLQADVTASTPEHQALLKRFALFGPPGIIFFDRTGREVTGLRVIGFQPPREFNSVLDQVLVAK